MSSERFVRWKGSKAGIAYYSKIRNPGPERVKFLANKRKIYIAWKAKMADNPDEYQNICQKINARRKRNFPAFYRKNRTKLLAKAKLRDKAKVKQYARRATVTYRQKMREVRKQLIDRRGGKCMRCPVDNPLLLDFDHIDPETKDFSLSVGVMNKPIEVLEKEADKCQLLCSNCHRLKTFETGQWGNKRYRVHKS